MMLKEKSSPWARLKYVYVLPLAAIAVTAFARPEISETAKEISAVKVNDLTAIVEVKMEEIADKNNLETVSNDSLKRSKQTKRKGGDAFTVTGVKGNMDNESMELAASSISIKNLGNPKPLILINGVEATGDDPLGLITPEQMKNVTILKGKKALALYGEKAKNGVLKVELKSNDSLRIQVQAAPSVPLTKVVRMSNVAKPLIIIDGKEATGDDVLAGIPADHVKSFVVLKDKSATEIYGDKGKDGVLLVSMMTDEEFQYRKEHPQEPYYDALEMAMSRKKEFINAEKMVFFIDGKEVTSDEAAKLLAKDVHSMKLVEDKERTSVSVSITSEKDTKK